MLKKFRKSIDKLKEQNQLINARVETYYDESAEKDYLDFFTRVINRLLDGERSSIFISDPENNTAWLEVGTGIERKQITVPKEGSMVGGVIACGEVHITNDMEAQEGAHKEVDSATGFTTHNAICVPVKSLDGKRITGAIQVLNKKSGEPFNAHDQKWLEDIARNLQFNIEHIYLQQETLTIVDKVFNAINQLWTILVAVVLASMTGLFLFMMSFWLAA